MKLTDVSFSYGEKKVLDHFSLEWPDRGVFALAGPSGSGKTTLLRLLAGLECPDSGTITAPPPGRIAVLFQENRLLPGLTAADQLRAVLPRGADVEPWLVLAGLKTEENALPDTLSGGMQRRLALVRCMAYGADKSLLLLDEPFTGIDPARVSVLMTALRRMNTPILYAAHDAGSLSLADEVIRFEGPPLHPMHKA